MRKDTIERRIRSLESAVRELQYEIFVLQEALTSEVAKSHPP